jgi:DGQHR domain-containing protein
VAAAIKLSTLPEVLEFLGVDPADVGQDGIISNVVASAQYDGSILPEEASGFPKGYKVVSFYADAASLLQRAFVLRRKGWRGSQEAYQRMLIPSKVEAIRQGLKSRGQVAVNNIIATLPSDVLPIGADNHTVQMEKLINTAPVKITLPLRSNSIGLIDGQHRLFSYYRTKDDDKDIAKLRHQQNLLVTGIIYPPKMDHNESERFEARLFLTINSNQSSAPADLRQEIEVILDPTSPVAISKQVMERLAASGPLFGYVERYFYDKGKLKTSSIVNFGLVPLLKLSGKDSLFTVFEHPERDALAGGGTGALQPYIQLSFSKISEFLSAVRYVTKPERWTTDAKVPDRLLTATFIIGFLITMRMLTERGIDINFDDMKVAMDGFDAFDLKPYSSSQYNRMAAAIMKKHFNVDVSTS